MSDQVPDFETFGRAVWEKLSAQPLGALPKRELELALLSAALDAGAAEPNPASVATVFRALPRFARMGIWWTLRFAIRLIPIARRLRGLARPSRSP